MGAQPYDEVLRVEAAPPRKRFTDEFEDRVLEGAFRRDYEHGQLGQTGRTLSLLVLLIMIGFAGVDHLVFGDSSPWLLVRFGFLVPAMFVAVLVTRTKWYPPRHDPVVAAELFVTAAGIATIGFLGEPPGRELYLATATTVALALPTARVGARAVLGTVGAVTLFLSGLALASDMSSGVKLFIFLNTPTMGLFAFFGARIIESGARTNFLQRRTIEAERHRSEALLLNVLPEPIARRLKTGSAVIADTHGEVTVLFADIAGFTPMAAKLTAEQLVERLNTLFTDFDRLADRRGVEKIKTIGDAYMVAGGVPNPSPRAAESIAELALDMLASVRAVSEGFGQPLEIRAGIHTGPAVAGVIGSRKFSYDLWGETVNTASRMESHGEPGRVHVSEAARRRLGDAYAFEDRGEIEVKGIGKMRTFFLTGRQM